MTIANCPMVIQPSGALDVAMLSDSYHAIPKARIILVLRTVVHIHRNPGAPHGPEAVLEHRRR